MTLAKNGAGGMILRGASASVAGLGVRLGARLLFLIVAGQLYGAVLFGAFSLAVAAIELGVALGGLSMKRLIFQHLDERGARPADHVLADALVLVILVSLALAGSIMAVVALLPESLVSANTGRALILLAPMIVGQAVLDLLLAATRWKHMIRYEVVGRSIVEPYAVLAAAAAAFYAGYATSGLLIGYWVGTLAALAFAAAGVRRCLGPFALRGWRPGSVRLLAMLRGALTNTATDAMSGLFLRLDLYLVGILLGERTAGIYNMARQLAQPIRQVRQGFDGLLTPLVAKTLHKEGAERTASAIASATRLILSLQLPMAVAMCAVAYPLLRWLGPEFAVGWLAAILLGCAETVQGAYGIGDLIFAYRRPRLGLQIYSANVGVALLAGYALTAAWGMNGAAAAVLITYGVRAWLRRAVLKARLGVGVPIHHSLGPLLAGGAGAAAALLTPLAFSPGGAPAWPAALAAGLAVYAALLFAWLRLARETLALRDFSAE
ncbi:MAG TPA: oligosaccharide flippase family protein [Allosphingosinicella sp.]|nr:oligosaccharide flippase family protein [Allosphingosinicella sp.]